MYESKLLSLMGYDGYSRIGFNAGIFYHKFVSKYFCHKNSNMALDVCTVKSRTLVGRLCSGAEKSESLRDVAHYLEVGCRRAVEKMGVRGDEGREADTRGKTLEFQMREF